MSVRDAILSQPGFRHVAALNRDARHWQILALSSLFVLAYTVSDFGTSPLSLLAAVSGAMLAQGLGTRITSGAFKGVQWKSALITSLSLSILLRASDPSFWFAAGLIGVGAKFLIRYNGKHIFNPACIGIVSVSLLAGPNAWVSPGQWGQAPIFAVFAIGLAALVLSSAKRLDIALGFLAAAFAAKLGWASWYGDPYVIPVHQMQNGALLVFAFFMITDPRSTPDSRAGRLIFAAVIAALASFIGWWTNLPGEPLYALALAAPLTILLDKLLPAGRFQWGAGPISKEGYTHETETDDDRRGLRAPGLTA